MKTLTRIGPLGLTNFMFNNLFDEIFNADPNPSANVLYNLIKNETGHELEFNVAGYAKDKISIEIEDKQLVVSYEDEPPNIEYVIRNFNNRSFKKTFTLNDIDIKNIKAKHENGILRIVLPKVKENISRKIEVE